MARQQYQQQTRLLAGEPQREAIIRLIQNLPADAERPLEIVVRERQKTRSLPANARLWAGPLKDISEQAWIEGRQHSIQVWAEYFKENLLPEDGTPEADPTNGYVKDGYVKWVYGIDGKRHLVGSTTQLTAKGFSEHVTMIEAFGANLGVHFSAPPAKEHQP